MALPVTLDQIVSLCKRRGFVFPGSEIYGGLANSWDYGPLGVELKNNIKALWWKRFVRGRDDVVGIDAALIMNPKVWEASGHLKEFHDSLVQCKECNSIFRDDEIPGIDSIDHSKKDSIGETLKNTYCPNPKCSKKGNFTSPTLFNLMLATNLGPVEDKKSKVYFRPETAQAMFVDFKNVLDTTRQRVPFGIAQIGRAFRNEITPGNFIFRTREFEMMEIEYFVREGDWKTSFGGWQKEMWSWMTDELGLDKAHVHELEIPEDERAHYSKRTIDFEYDFPFGRRELYGLAYRTDFDLKNHFPDSPPYRDPETGEEFWPHVIEPTWGVDRSVLAVLCEAYDASDPERLVLHLSPKLAPFKAAVFPLLRNKPELVKKAREVYSGLQKELAVTWDDRGNIGKRYLSQDEIGTPWCITVDFQTLENGMVTVRDRDTMKQDRISVAELSAYLQSSS